LKENVNFINLFGITPIKKSVQLEKFFCKYVNDRELRIPKKGDFLVDDKYVFEIGEKSKKQIKNIENSFIVKDGTKIRDKNIIPLWLFGFLY